MFSMVFLMMPSVLAVFFATLVFLLLLFDVVCWVIFAGVPFDLVFPVFLKFLPVFAVFVFFLRF